MEENNLKISTMARSDEPQSSRSQLRPGADSEGGAGKPCVLLVEDDELVREHAVHLLESMGYTVRACHDAYAALAVLEKGEPFDLLFTDIVMPGDMNGFELARALRAARPGLPVLCTSGYAGTSLVAVIRETTDFGFINKPYRRSDLARCLREALA